MKIARTALNTGSKIAKSSAAALLALTLMAGSSVSLSAKADNVKPGKALGQKATAAQYTSDELIVMPKANVEKEDLDASIEKMGGTIGEKDLMGKFFTVKVDPKHIDEIFKAAKKDPNFAIVQRNGVYQAQYTTTPNDPGFSQQFYLAQLNIPNAWALGAAGQGITIGSLDTGVDFNNLDLVNRFKNTGYASAFNSYNAYDYFAPYLPEGPFSHGTFTMTCAAASTNNAFGFAAPAFLSQIEPVNITPGTGSTTDMYMARGLEFLILNHVKLANLSFNSSDPNHNFSVLSSSPIFKYAMSVFVGYGGLLFNSAGNDGNLINGVTFPGFVPVAAVNQDNTPASFTDYGAQIQFAAPGVGITNTGFGSVTFTLDGTSFAAPLTAGVAAQVWGTNPSLTATQVQQIMQSTAAVPSGADKRFYGYGIPNAAAAVSLAGHSF